MMAHRHNKLNTAGVLPFANCEVKSLAGRSKSPSYGVALETQCHTGFRRGKVKFFYTLFITRSPKSRTMKVLRNLHDIFFTQGT